MSIRPYDDKNMDINTLANGFDNLDLDDLDPNLLTASKSFSTVKFQLN